MFEFERIFRKKKEVLQIMISAWNFENARDTRNIGYNQRMMKNIYINNVHL
jgi:hypothetical protein